MAENKEHIVIVEDDEDIQQLVSYNLIKAGFLVTCVYSGDEVLVTVRAVRPDLVLLDLMLPGMDGLSVCRTLKSDTTLRATPVIMLTAKGEESDIVTGFNLGADDYITKPFSPKVLVARVQAALRRRNGEGEGGRDAELTFRGLAIHTGRHEVRLDGRPLTLTLTEFGILHLLAGRPGWVFTRQQMIDAVRGYEYMVTERAMDVQIYSLRKKLGSAGRYIETVRGIGYRFQTTES